MRSNVAGLIMVGFEGVALSSFVKRAVADVGVGGVIFFKRNVESEEQLSSLCREIIRLSPHNPPFLAIDQEGGRVSRIGEGLAVLPGNMALGAARSTDLAGRAGRVTALQIGQLGLNLVLAPVLDVISNPENRVIGTRSYGGDPRLVAELGDAYIKGVRAGGALSAAKHFPGLGKARYDPHYEPTPIDVPLRELMSDDLLPFRGSRADFIMSSHAVYACLDPGTATLSGRVLGDLLREELRYDGPVVSDDLCMKAISGSIGMGEAAVRFLNAGGDMILACEGEGCLDEIVRAVEDALAGRHISRDALSEKQRRLDAARGRLGGGRDTFSRGELEELSLEIARSSVTRYGAEAGVLPLAPGSGERVLVIETRYPGRGEGPSFLVDLFRRRHEETESLLVELVPSEEEMGEAAERASRARIAIVLTYDSQHYVQQLKLLGAVAEQCGKLICLSTGTPYDLPKLGRAGATLATYGCSAASMAAAVEILFGERAASGVLPVNIRV